MGAPDLGERSPEPLPGLHWGIKATFFRYVSQIPDGRGTIGGGATPGVDGDIVFAPAADGALVCRDTLAFRGDVRLLGHHGMLYVRIADPVITIDRSEAELTILDPYAPDRSPRMSLVSFTASLTSPGEEAPLLTSAEVRLHAAATALFNDVYPPGELFEPLSVHVPRGTSRREAP